jgi:hypothetical protein
MALSSLISFFLLSTRQSRPEPALIGAIITNTDSYAYWC